MSGKSQTLKKHFHEACRRVIAAQLGEAWYEDGRRDESWTVGFQRDSTMYIHLLSLRLTQSRHEVEVILAIKNTRDDPTPRTWWDDRKLHPDAKSYATILWCGDIKYGHEESIQVSRNSWLNEFQEIITDRLVQLRDRMESWFADAEVELSRGNA